MLLSVVFWALIFLNTGNTSSLGSNQASVDFELPIELKIVSPAKLPDNLQTVDFAPIQIKKALKVLSASVDLEALFTKYADEYGIDKNSLKKIADCESHFGTGAKNGDYGGMFQFTTGTWQGTRNQMGLDPNPDLRFSGEESIRTAAFKISRGGIGAWPACSKI